MDAALVAAWHSITIPYNPSDVDELLVKSGLMTERAMKAAHLLKSQLAKADIKRKRKKEATGSDGRSRRYRQRLTNTHLLETAGYQWLKPQAAGGKK